MKTFMNVLLSLVLTTLVGCSCDAPSGNEQSSRQLWMTQNGKVKVLSTISMIDDLVRQIGNGYVDSSVLILGELDPHSYQLVKGDDEKLAFADIIFYNGLGLEHGPSLHGYLAEQKKAIGLGDKIQAAEPSAILEFRGQTDPHIWMDIGMWSKTVPYIVQALSEKDPAHADVYHANGEKLMKTMLEANAKVKDELQQIPAKNRYLVTSHDAFAYFTRAYLVEDQEDVSSWMDRFAAPEGLAPESQISTSHIKEIIEHLKQFDIRVIFSESNVNRDSLRKIVQAANQQGMEVRIADVALYADAMGPTGSEADTYLKMIQYNAKAIAEKLKHSGD